MSDAKKPVVRGSNAGLPPVWLIYITVEDLARSVLFEPPRAPQG
jgi:hypothetical protein